jgi:hypothetical protein
MWPCGGSKAMIFPFSLRKALYPFTAFYSPSSSSGVKKASKGILKPLAQERAKPQRHSVHASLQRF